MKKSGTIHRLFATALLASALAACGGGGGGSDDDDGDNGGGVTPVADAADKYVGTWFDSCSAFEGNFETETLTITKTSANAMSVRLVLRTYGNAGCTGAPASTETFDGTVTIDSQTTASYQGQSRTFDQVTAVIPGEGTLKWLAGVVPDNRLVIDFEDNNAGSSATQYPTNPNEGETEYVRQ